MVLRQAVGVTSGPPGSGAVTPSPHAHLSEEDGSHGGRDDGQDVDDVGVAVGCLALCVRGRCVQHNTRQRCW